jgi:hypothetical protein
MLAAFIICFDGKQAFAQDAGPWSGTCAITFSGKSTLHNFAGSVEAEPFTVTISNPGDPAKAGISGRVTVKAAKMDTGNKKRDVNMREAMEVITYPDIVAEVTDWVLAKAGPAEDGSPPHPAAIPFTLTIKGKKHKLRGTVTDWSSTGNTITCAISFPVSLKTSGIVVPSVLGLIKVDDQIQVKAKLVLKKT